MTRLFIILIFLPIMVSGQTIQLIERAEKLKEYYSKSTIDKDSLKYQKLFFDVFPVNFNDFNAIFGWSDNKDINKALYGPLYDGHDEIYFFFRLKGISEKEFYQKIIDIAIGGHWEADAVNYFQQGLRDKVLANPKLTFDLLKGKSDSDIKSFFFFFFQSTHPVYKTIPNVLTTMKSYDSKVYGLMEKGLDEALKQSGH